VTEDGVTASGYGAENAWEVRAVRYSPVADELRRVVQCGELAIDEDVTPHQAQ